MTIKYLVISLCLFCSISLISQGHDLGTIEEEPIMKIELDPISFYNKAIQARNATMALPFEKLGYSEFTITEDEMLAPDYAKARPDIKTYVIQSTKDKSVKGRMLLTPNSSWATILTPQGLASFYPKDGAYFLEEGIHYHQEQGATCSHIEKEGRISEWEKKLKTMDETYRVSFTNAGTRKVFELAIVCTGEFYVANGGNDTDVNETILGTVNGLNVIYENELSVFLNPEQPILYNDPATDPFEPDMGGEERTLQASKVIPIHFDLDEYDVGHVFHTHAEGDGWSSGGVAILGSVCDNGMSGGGVIKAGGWSGAFSNKGNGWISLSAHEFGHMFSATHTFNGGGSDNCDNSISATSAYEIGSGTTIMSYQGLCAPAQNIIGGGEADNYFHVHSLSQMVMYLNVFADCADEVPLDNTAPIVAAKPCVGDVVIPKNTPFRLTGSATDGEGDNLTYTWEQYDEDGESHSLTQGFIGTQAANSTIAPLFRSFSPSNSPSRYFPRLSTLVEGPSSDVFDVLPNRARTLHFQLTARDNNSVGGGIASSEMEVVVDNSGPLSLQNLSSVDVGTPFMVNWTLNGTEALCDVADILLSIDGGQSFTITLAENVDYSTGSFEVTLPTSFPNSENARIMLACADAECYAFFDITNNDFDIVSSCLAGSSIICNSEYEEFEQGDPTLDLSLSHFDGSAISSMSQVIDETGSTVAPILIYSDTGGCIEQSMYFTANRKVVVDKTGIYTFTVDVDANGGRGFFAIYDAATYDVNNACASFVGANATEAPMGLFFIQSSLSVTLEECKEYLLVITNNKPPMDLPKTTVISNIEGPGTMIEVDDTPNVDFDHTFIAVNDQGIIEVVSPSSNFTALSGGLYDICTVTYKTGGATPPENVDPATWVGSPLSEVQATNCIQLSSNKKQILVEFTCRITTIELGNQTACDPNTNTYSQEVIITYDDPPLSGNLTVNGAAFPISGSPQTVVLVGQFADGMTLGVSAEFSELSTCMKFVENLIIAPENCCPIEFDLGEDRVVCDNEEVILDAGDDGISYKWFKDGAELMTNESTLLVTESGNYLVEVVNETSCAKFDVVNITINPSPTVELDEDFSVCEGEIQLVQSNTDAPNLVWFKDGVELMGETDANLLVTEAGTYVLIGTNGFNCTDMDTIVIDYVPRPIVELGENQMFCEGDPAYTLDAGMDGTQYIWSRNTTVILSETESTLDVTESGQYTVVVDNGGGCDTRDTVDIVFHELSEVFAGNDINICEGNTGQIFAVTNAVSYEWFFGGMPFDDQTLSPTVSEEGEYILVGKNDFECELSDTVVVTQVMPPDVDLGEDLIGCIGTEITLTVDNVGIIAWVNDGMVLTTDASITITESGLYIANVIAASECSGRDSIMVSFVPGPTIELGEDKEFCMGDSDIITAASDGDNITWFLDDVEIAGENQFELMVTDAGVYKAIVTGVGNCEVEDSVTITVNEVPDLVLGEDEVICDGESVTLMTDFGADIYDWQLNGMSISDQPSVDVSEAGIYTLTVINEFDCSDSDEIEVMSNARPIVEVEESYSICEGVDVDVVAMGDGSSFQWFVNGEEQVGVTGNTITVNEASMIEVIASSEAGCTTTETTQVIVVGAPTIELGDDFSLCPAESFVLNAGVHTTYMWSNGQESASINIVSINPVVASQETYSVTVTNEAGCSAEDVILVDLLPVIQGDVLTSATGVCNGEPVELIASGGLTYEWVDPNGSLTTIEGPLAIASPTETTTYQVYIRDNCPDNLDIISIDIEVFEADVSVDAGEDDCAVNGSTLELNATGGITYQWDTNTTIISGEDSANPVVSPTVDTIYFVNITDENGCIFRDSVNICVLDDPLENFKLVSIITPNGDGDNDELIFEGLEAFPDNVLTIYNRWGYPVFERQRYQMDSELWNGENGGDILPADTYYYILTFDGNTYKSTVTIMR